MTFKKLFFTFFLCLMIFSLVGCDAFVRKFTRKSKKEDLPREELVLSPEEYKPPQMTKEEQYRQYFLYWKSWHDELLTSITEGRPQEKQLDCAQEAIKNLEQLHKMLNPDKQNKLDVYMGRLNDIKDSIAKDVYNMGAPGRSTSVEKVRMDIMRDFSYPKVKNSLL